MRNVNLLILLSFLLLSCTRNEGYIVKTDPPSDKNSGTYTEFRPQIEQEDDLDLENLDNTAPVDADSAMFKIEFESNLTFNAGIQEAKNALTFNESDYTMLRAEYDTKIAKEQGEVELFEEMLKNEKMNLAHARSYLRESEAKYADRAKDLEKIEENLEYAKENSSPESADSQRRILNLEKGYLKELEAGVEKNSAEVERILKSIDDRIEVIERKREKVELLVSSYNSELIEIEQQRALAAQEKGLELNEEPNIDEFISREVYTYKVHRDLFLNDTLDSGRIRNRDLVNLFMRKHYIDYIRKTRDISLSYREYSDSIYSLIPRNEDLTTFKINYEQLIDDNIRFNIEASTMADMIFSKNVKSYSGTSLFITLRILQQVERNHDELVVIIVNGHILPGFLEVINGRKYLRGIESTSSDSGYVDFGETHSIKGNIRVFNARQYLITELLDSEEIKNKDEVFEQLVNYSIKQYGFQHGAFAELKESNKNSLLSLGDSSVPNSTIERPKTPANFGNILAKEGCARGVFCKSISNKSIKEILAEGYSIPSCMFGPKRIMESDNNLFKEKSKIVFNYLISAKSDSTYEICEFKESYDPNEIIGPNVCNYEEALNIKLERLTGISECIY